MSQHLQRATFFFHDLTDEHPKAEMPQRYLYKTMHRLDKTPLSALADKWNAPSRSNYLGPVQCWVRAEAVAQNTAALPARLPSKLRYHIFELIYNAVPTRAREEWRGHNVLCPLCNTADEIFFYNIRFLLNNKLNP